MIVSVTLNGIAMQETEGLPKAGEFTVRGRVIHFHRKINKRHKYLVQVVEEKNGGAMFYFADMYRNHSIKLTKGKKIRL